MTKITRSSNSAANNGAAKQFARELQKSEPALDLLALYIAQIAYPNLDLEENLEQLNELADLFIAELSTVAPGYERAHRFLTLFNDDLDFQGSLENYYHADNSFLNKVLSRRVGLPILLSLVCIVIGAKIRKADLGIGIQGVGLPSHFMVRYVDVAGVWLLDPFYGKVLPPEDAVTYLNSLFSSHGSRKIMELPANLLRPVSTQMLCYRLLNNLRILYINDSNYQMAINILDFMIEISADDSQLWKERGLLNHHQNNLEQASRDLRRYFFLKDKWIVASGIIPDAEMGTDISSGFLLDTAILDEYTSDEWEPDSASENGAAAGWDEDSLSDRLHETYTDPKLEHEFDDSFEEDEYIELSDEEYYLLNVLADIEEMRTSLN